MIIVYCWCGNLELGWLGSLGYILFQSNWSLKQTSEISQECVIDDRMLKCTFPSLPPPQDGSTSVGGREGDWGVREQSVIERCFLFLLSHSDFLLSIPLLLTLLVLQTDLLSPQLLWLCQDSACLTAASPFFLPQVLFLPFTTQWY